MSLSKSLLSDLQRVELLEPEYGEVVEEPWPEEEPWPTDEKNTMGRVSQMNKDAAIVNMSDPAIKREIMVQVGRLTGLYEFYLKPRKRTRSLDQNSYYFAAVVTPFRDWLRENYGDSQISTDEAHDMLKVKILGLTEKLIPNSQEAITMFPRSKYMTVEEFSEYIEKCAAWLAEFCQIVVVPSDLFHEGEPLNKKGK